MILLASLWHFAVAPWVWILMCVKGFLSASGVRECPLSTQSYPVLCDFVDCCKPGSRPPLSPGACSYSCPWRRWCHPAISSSVARFSGCPQSFPASGSFPVCRLFASGGQSVGASASASIVPVNIWGCFPLRLTDLLVVQGTVKSLLQHHSLKASVLWFSTKFFTAQLSHSYNTFIVLSKCRQKPGFPAEKTTALTIWTFVGKVMSLLFNTVPRFVIDFLPRSKCLLISWLQSPSTVILKSKKMKSVTASAFPPSVCHEVMGPDAYSLNF